MLARQSAAEAQRKNPERIDTVIVVSANKYPGIAAVAPYLPGRDSAESYAQALRNLIAGYAVPLTEQGADDRAPT